jgi:hypothetical protein
MLEVHQREADGRGGDRRSGSASSRGGMGSGHLQATRTIGDTQIVLAAVPAQGQVASVTALETTRAILMRRLGAVRSLFTQPPSVQIVTTGERQQLVVDVHLAGPITPSQVVMNLLGQVPQMVRDRQWSFHLPADNDRHSRLQEVMSLLRQGQFSIPAAGSTFLASGRSAARVPVLVSNKDITPSVRMVRRRLSRDGPGGGRAGWRLWRMRRPARA